LTILVTGSSGFVGEILIKKLRELEIDTIGIDWKKGKYTDIIQDISQPFTIEKKIDVVVHLAARLEHDRCTQKEYFLANVNGTENVLSIAKSFNAYFIYISATAIYGDPISPITEETTIAPNGNYALTKWKGEEICQKFQKDGLKIAIIRPTVILGKKRLGIYKVIFKSLINNKKIPLLGDGSNKISFINVEDLCDYIIHLSNRKLSDLIVNFGGVIPGDLNEVIHDLKEYSRSNSDILHVPLSLIGILKIFSRLKIIPVTPWQLSVMHKDYFFDNKKLHSTGFDYKYKPIDALKSMIDNYKEMN